MPASVLICASPASEISTAVLKSDWLRAQAAAEERGAEDGPSDHDCNMCWGKLVSKREYNHRKNPHRLGLHAPLETLPANFNCYPQPSPLRLCHRDGLDLVPAMADPINTPFNTDTVRSPAPKVPGVWGAAKGAPIPPAPKPNPGEGGGNALHARSDSKAMVFTEGCCKTLVALTLLKLSMKQNIGRLGYAPSGTICAPFCNPIPHTVRKKQTGRSVRSNLLHRFIQ